jgi:thioredoxin reductase (NADPH)
LGFPRGLSGSELTNRATEQAWLFGAEFVLARRAERLHRSETGYVVSLSDSTDVTARAVVLATGVEWRRLGVPSVEALLGVGVYYGAAGAEADALEGEPVFVVGGGNSAGQAAVHLARHAESVTILIRSQSLAASMSDYLISQLEAVENIHVRAMTEVVGASGQTRLQRLTLRQRQTGAEEEIDAAALFVMIGGQPHTEWLPEHVQRDSHGYVLTGVDVRADTLARTPLFLETSLQGVFAVGDVRHGATRRVAPSVGSGAIAINLVHQYLADRA